jgi:hypothetical protein
MARWQKSVLVGWRSLLLVSRLFKLKCVYAFIYKCIVTVVFCNNGFFVGRTAPTSLSLFVLSAIDYLIAEQTIRLISYSIGRNGNDTLFDAGVRPSRTGDCSSRGDCAIQGL